MYWPNIGQVLGSLQKPQNLNYSTGHESTSGYTTKEKYMLITFIDIFPLLVTGPTSYCIAIDGFTPNNLKKKLNFAQEL